jgi:hypothetical protein
MIKEQITVLIKGYLDPIIETFVNSIFTVIDTIIDFTEMLVDWLFDRISLNKAEMMLTIWVVRE